MSAVGSRNAGQGFTLALDAASSIGTVAVLDGWRVVSERAVEMRGTDGERYMPAILAALAEAGTSVRDLQGVTCGAGPGSFTSLRVAGAIAKGIAMGTGCPLFAVPSLALIVAASPLTVAEGSRWLASLDAMRGDRYLALVTVGADGAIERSEPLGLPPGAEIAARAAALGAQEIGPGAQHHAMPHARGVERCRAIITAAGPVDLAAWEPVYGRLAEAQVKRNQATAARVLVIRAATAEDLPAIAAIEQASFSDPWSVKSFQSMLAHTLVTATVAERAGRVIGYCVAWLVGEEGEVVNFAVDPRERRSGAGAALLGDLLRATDAAGVISLFLEVRESNLAARTLYERRGFAVSGRRRAYYAKPIEDALVMRWEKAATVGDPR